MLLAVEFKKAFAENCLRTKLVDVDVQVEPQVRGMAQSARKAMLITLI